MGLTSTSSRNILAFSKEDAMLHVLILIVCMLPADGTPPKVDDCGHQLVRTLYTDKSVCDARLRELILQGDAEGKSVVGTCQEVRLPKDE